MAIVLMSMRVKVFMWPSSANVVRLPIGDNPYLCSGVASSGIADFGLTRPRYKVGDAREARHHDGTKLWR